MPEKSWCFGEARRPYTMRLTPGEGRAETLLICRWRTYRQILPYKCSTKPKSAFRYVTAHPPEGTEQEMGLTEIYLCSDWHLIISFAHSLFPCTQQEEELRTHLCSSWLSHHTTQSWTTAKYSQLQPGPRGARNWLANNGMRRVSHPLCHTAAAAVHGTFPLGTLLSGPAPSPLSSNRDR